MKLLIVIVNYRSADLTIDCLRSLEPELADMHGPRGVKVVVTDNKSPDDSVRLLNTVVLEHGWSHWVTIKPLDRNGGFAYGNNAAISAALAEPHRPEFILLLNPDTVIRPGAIKTLLEFMQNNPKVGIAGSRLEDPDGTPQRSAFRFHSIAGEFERGIRMGLVTKLLKHRMIAPPVTDQTGPPCPCDWVAGASMIVRREVFESAGLMDEQYFMYFEEVDFCLAATRKGWLCWYVPASRVVHLVGAVSQLSDNRKHRSRRPAYWFESRRRYFVKNHGRVYATLADIAYLVAHTCWRLRRLVQRKEDTDPPKLLRDSISHSVFVRGWAV
jgi:N-acetylglucosaminyl-diphospho-decaprenol L-rhamnosyltransferase